MPASNKRERKHERRISVVTGATSSIGVHVIRRLLKRGDEVRVIIKESIETSNSWRSLPPGCIPYIADLTLKRRESDRDTLMSACKGADNIIHLAGASFNYKSTYDQLIELNVMGTENLLRAFLDANSGTESKCRFIHASSVTVYGYKRPGEVLKEESETKPASGYSESKLMAERVIQSFAAANSSISYTILRFGVIYGNGYENEFFKIFRLIKDGRIALVGNGENHLTLVNVEDAADAVMLSSETTKAQNKTYNITDGVPYTQKFLFERAAKFLGASAGMKSVHPLLAKLGAKAKGINFDAFEFLVSDRRVSIEHASHELGFKPSGSIDVEGKELAEEFLKTYKG